MGTVMNGNKWSGACVNGNVVSGLAKNGVVFYKKIRQEIYKRRIMVGDDLGGKTLYLDLPEGFQITTSEQFIKTNISNYIEKTLQSVETGQPNVQLSDANNFTFINLIGKEQYTVPTGFGTVSNTVPDDDAYRRIYIEDENIRPLQVGDKIVIGTKFYFNFPDGFADEVGWDESIFYYMRDTYGDTLFAITGVGAVIGSTVFTMIVYSDANSPMGFFRNESTATATDLGNVEVGSIEGTYFDKYIMVDTTTLGT